MILFDYNLFLQSLKTIYLSIGKWLFGSFGSSVALCLLLSNKYNWNLLDSIGIGIITYIGVSFIGSIFNYYTKIRKQQIVLPLKNIYGEAIIVLAEGFAKVHHHRKNVSPNAQNIIDTLIIVCSCVKKIFDAKTGSKCSVSIKVLTSNVLIDENVINPEAEIITLCRDEDSLSSRNSNGKKVKHNIFSNSCFNHILDNIGKPKGKYYLNNNLPGDTSYRSTTFEIYGKLPDDCIDEKERTKKWTLPFMSEIVVPITPMIENNHNKNEMIGYLCVDCLEKNVFNYV